MSNWRPHEDAFLPSPFHDPSFMSNGKFVFPSRAARPHGRFRLPTKGEEVKSVEWLLSQGSVGLRFKIEAPDLFQSERDAFLRLKDELLSDPRYRGRYVAILKQSVVDFDDDKVRLAQRVYKKHGYVPIYMDIVDEKRRILDMPSPETHRK